MLKLLEKYFYRNYFSNMVYILIEFVFLYYVMTNKKESED